MYKVSKKTYEKVMQACHEQCVLCGRQYPLQLHHILGRGKFLTDDPTNCVMLCMDCHLYKVHMNQKKYRPMLLEIAKNIYNTEIIAGPQGSDAVRNLRKIITGEEK